MILVHSGSFHLDIPKDLKVHVNKIEIVIFFSKIYFLYPIPLLLNDLSTHPILQVPKC